MTKDELIAKLKECATNDDTEVAHSDADDFLIEYINDPDIEAAYHSINKWYA